MSVNLEQTLGINDPIQAASENLRTGRKGTVHDSETDIPHPRVRELVETITSPVKEPNWRDVIDQHDLAQDILTECRDEKIEGLQRSYYRAQPFDEGAPPPSTTELLSPPEDDACIGRYNPMGDAVLYLARTQETAATEVQPNEQKQIYLQEFEIDAPDISCLKLSSDMEQESPYLHHLLLLSERLPEEIGAKKAYWPTHFLRQICADLGISAIEFPSIRAKYGENPDAVNLVIYGDAVDEVERMTQGTPFKYE